MGNRHEKDYTWTVEPIWPRLQITSKLMVLVLNGLEKDQEQHS
jgi:hypothetical protein